MYEGEHVPRLWKAGLLLVLGTLAIAGSSFTYDWKNGVGVAGYLFGGICVILSLVEAYLSEFAYLAGTRERQYTIQKEIIEALSNADAETRLAIGIKLPHYRYKYVEGATKLFWEDSETITREIFKEFLEQSNDRYTVAQRDWKARSSEYHRYWLLIYSELVKWQLVLANSSAGSHSEQWINNGYKKAWEYWGQLPGALQELE